MQFLYMKSEEWYVIFLTYLEIYSIMYLRYMINCKIYYICLYDIYVYDIYLLIHIEKRVAEDEEGLTLSILSEG